MILNPIRRSFLPAIVAVAALAASAAIAEQGRYQTPEAFIAEAFPEGTPDARAVWLRSGLRSQVADILGHPPVPRVRYWQKGQRTAWILDEIGKEKPITTGVVVQDGAIETVKVLEFRESRGWEVKYAFFTRQFVDARLSGDHRLSRSIDGITGATLSVRAMDRMARVALLLDAHVRQPGDVVAAP